MKLFGWLKPIFEKQGRATYDWEEIGAQSPGGRGNLENVPDWVLKAYAKTDIHHKGFVYYFKGSNYQYKVVESGQGGSVSTFYRRLKGKP